MIEFHIRVILCLSSLQAYVYREDDGELLSPHRCARNAYKEEEKSEV